MERSNLQALTSLCRLIVSGYEPLEDVILQTLFDAHIDPAAAALPRDKELLICALHIIRGMNESSHSEDGISVSFNSPAVQANIKWYCKRYGLNPLDYLDDGGYNRIVREGSKLW